MNIIFFINIVKSGFYGIRPAVAGLIGAVSFELARNELLNLELYTATNNIAYLINSDAIILFALMFYLIRKLNKHPITYIVLAAIIGIVFKF